MAYQYTEMKLMLNSNYNVIPFHKPYIDYWYNSMPFSIAWTKVKCLSPVDTTSSSSQSVMLTKQEPLCQFLLNSTEWPFWSEKISCWLRSGMFRHPAGAVGSYSSGPRAAGVVGTKSTPGFLQPEWSPCSWAEYLAICQVLPSSSQTVSQSVSHLMRVAKIWHWLMKEKEDDDLLTCGACRWWPRPRLYPVRP